MVLSKNKIQQLYTSKENPYSWTGISTFQKYLKNEHETIISIRDLKKILQEIQTNQVSRNKKEHPKYRNIVFNEESFSEVQCDLGLIIIFIIILVENFLSTKRE